VKGHVIQIEANSPEVLIGQDALEKKSENYHLNFHKVDGFHESGGSGQHAGVQAATSGGDDLAASAMNGVSVKSHIINVEANTSHVLVTENTLIRSERSGLC